MERRNGRPTPAPRLTLLMGAEGAGKSRWTRLNRDQLPEMLLEQEMKTGSLARHEAARWRASAIRQGVPFGIETTFTGAWRHDLVQQALNRGYSITAIFVGTANPTVNINRVRLRHRAGRGRYVADTTLRRHWRSAQSNLIEHARAMDVIRVIDSTAHPTVEVARIRLRTEVHLKTPPAWTVALLAGLTAARRTR